MVGLERLTHRLLEDARTEVGTILDEADAKCFRIRLEAEEEAASLSSRHEEALAHELDSLRSRSAHARERKTTEAMNLAAKELADDLYSTVRERILAYPEEKYLRLLTALATRAIDALPSEKEEAISILLGEADRERYGKRLIKAISASHRTRSVLKTIPADICGGLIVRRGGISVNCTLGLLIEELRASTESDIYRMLTGNRSDEIFG